ncbi:MAG: trans-2-enoyl-CoA reductase family protein [Eubacteriales bacterium]|nr:trans-2-enoyl-CoA reductase family protein [Eubacteriales bacterium]
MIIQPKVREFICTTAHPLGCEETVLRQAVCAEGYGTVKGPKKVLIIGASTGYGLSARIGALVNLDADTLGIMYEKEASGKRTATAGWYNTRAFEKMAEQRGRYAGCINGDAFSREVKEEAAALIRENMGKAELVVYSLAAPRRKDEDGTVWSSALKTVGEPFTEKSLDLRNNTITEKTIAPALEEEILGTVKVMGGEDWASWIDFLKKEDVLAENAVTIAFSYIGPEMTYPIYYDGTIGRAKKHLHKTAQEICIAHPDVQAIVSVNKGLVTQASAAIPIVPLYLTMLYRAMKKRGTHEGCQQQMSRLFTQKMFGEAGIVTDENHLIRMDDYELEEGLQRELRESWKKVTPENLREYADIDGYWEDFYHMFGFGYDNIDYTKDIMP